MSDILTKLDAIEAGLEGVTPGFPRWIWLFGDRTVYTRDPSDGCRITPIVRTDYAGQNNEALAHIARLDPQTVRELVRLARMGLDLEQGREQYVRGIRVSVPISTGDF